MKKLYICFKNNLRWSQIFVSVLVLSSFFVIESFGQVPWMEDFSLADSTKIDEGETAWTAVRDNGILYVMDNMLIVNGGGDVGVFTTETLDISGGPVTISIDVSTVNGIDDGQDYVKLYAILDGGDPISLDSIDGEFLHGMDGIELAKGDGAPGQWGTLIGSNIMGNTLQIVIRTYLSSDSEFYYMDNLSITTDYNPVYPVIAINCGGNVYTAADGIVYLKDTLSTGGGTYGGNNDIAGTEDDVLYQTERYGNYSYDIPVENGSYDVILKIAEIYHENAGSRVWNVLIEGKEVLTNFDAASIAGKNVAIDTTINVKVVDGEINIETVTVKDNAKLSAIEIVANNKNVKWHENFSLADSTMVDNGATAWEAVRDNGIFHVSDNMLIVNGGGDIGVFTSEIIDISGDMVNVSVDVATVNGIDDGQDYVKLYAVIDGGTPIPLDSIDGEFLHGMNGIELQKGDGAPGEWGTLMGSKIEGTTLQIIMKTYLSADSEFYYLDNLKIEKVVDLSWVEDFSLADSTTVDSGETAWEAIRENGIFHVSDSMLIVNGGGDVGVFTSEIIDISGTTVNVSINVSTVNGIDDGQDYVKLYAIIDGGTPIALDSIDGEFLHGMNGIELEKGDGAPGEWGTLMGSNIEGNTLQIVMKTYLSADSEFYYLDNLTIKTTVAETYELIVVAEHATVTLSPGGSGVYEEGTEVTIELSSNYGYEFERWEGDITGTDNPLTVTMDSSISITAVFKELTQYTVQTSVENGILILSPAGGTYLEGTDVTFIARPNVGYKFTGWSGDISGMENPTTITVNADMVITAEIELIPAYTLSLTAGANGFAQALPDKETYAPGSAVVLVATPDEGYQFNGWEGDISGTDNPVRVFMDSSMNITANFVLITGVDDLYRNSDQNGLNQIYPNPFSEYTNITYQLNEAANIQLVIYNLLGEKIETLVNTYQTAGTYKTEWNARDNNGNPLSNGIYIFKLQIGDNPIDLRKVILQK